MVLLFVEKGEMKVVFQLDWKIYFTFLLEVVLKRMKNLRVLARIHMNSIS